MPIVQHLIAEQFGSHIGKYSKRLKITHKGEVLAQAPLLHLETVSILSRGVSVSADAIEACTERGIPIHFVDAVGTPYASLYSAGLTGTVLTRREQLRAYDDERGVALARAFAVGKIQNQASTLKYLARSRKESPTGRELQMTSLDLKDRIAKIERLTDGHVDSLRDHILGHEGNASRQYWNVVKMIIPDDYGWPGRKTRGAVDGINSLLNYGYGILYGRVERSLVLAGLDPFAGYIHVDRPGKPSLTLDLIEEFRQAVVDRVVFGLAARNFKIEQDDRARLTDVCRKQYAARIIAHLDASMRFEGKRYPLSTIIQMQARHLATFLRREREYYVPFKAEG